MFLTAFLFLRSWAVCGAFRAGRLSASSRSRSVQDQSETQDWNGASVKLSDRLRERLGQNRNEAASPILVADDSEAIPLPTRLQDGNEAFDAPLDLRGNSIGQEIFLEICFTDNNVTIQMASCPDDNLARWTLLQTRILDTILLIFTFTA